MWVVPMINGGVLALNTLGTTVSTVSTSWYGGGGGTSRFPWYKSCIQDISVFLAQCSWNTKLSFIELVVIPWCGQRT